MIASGAARSARMYMAQAGQQPIRQLDSFAMPRATVSFKHEEQASLAKLFALFKPPT